MSCDPPAPSPDLENPERLVPPPVGGTTLVKRQTEKHVLTSRRECDAETAVRRGLKEYLEQVYVDVNGVRVQYQRVFDVWAESEETAVYPSAVVTTIGDTQWDASNFTPVTNVTKTADGLYLVKYHEVVFDLVLESHCSSPQERAAIQMLLEDALNPVDWMSGFKLDLPHYFNQRVVYTPILTRFLDSSDLAIRRLRPGTITIQAQVSLLRPRKLPNMEVRTQVEVTDGVESL